MKKQHPLHPLASWMEDHKEMSQAKLADKCECSESHLSLVLAGQRGVSMKLAKRLSDATDGVVKVADFLREDSTGASQ